MRLHLAERFVAAANNVWMRKRSGVLSASLRRCMGLNCPSSRSWHTGRASKRIRLEDSWYCPACIESAIMNVLSRLPSGNRQYRIHHRVPIGLLMLARGQITARQLHLALDAQRASGTRKFGAWLLELRFSTEQQITAALGRQWSCPVLSDSVPLQAACLSLLPLPLEESFRMVPVHYVENTNVLHIAFAENIDYTTLYAIQQSLGYTTAPCLATASFFREALERARSLPRPSDLVFETCADKVEMSRIAANYVCRLRADRVRVTHCAAYIWVRLECRSSAINLLFRDRQTDLVGHALSA